MICLNALPLIYALILFKKQENLAIEPNVRKFGSLIDGLSIRDRKSKHPDRKKLKPYLHPVIFFVRRALFSAVITFVIFDHPILQVISHIILSLMMLAYLVKSGIRF